MKTRHRSIALLLLVAVACASQSANQTAYITVGATVKTVDLAMRTWASYVVAGHSTPAQEAQVRDAYGKYQATARTLALVVEATNQNPTPEQFSAAAGSILLLVEQFTGKTIPVQK